MAIAIKASKLTRDFGHVRAVDGISFSIQQGDVLGFLGPNGAGKSTTMKMLSCYLTPTSGTAQVGGHDIIEDSREVRSCIGYVPENAPLYGEMEVADFLAFIAEVKVKDSAKQKKEVERVIELTDLGRVRRQRIETLSKGFKRRVGLAQAFINDPEILILDEPTDGLDPNQKFEVRKLIRAMAEKKCIIISTHILEEVDEVCNRLVIISRGKVVLDDEVAAVKQRTPRLDELFREVTR